MLLPALRCALQEAHIAKLRQNLDTGGDASLQNALDLCVDALKSIPPYGHRWAPLVDLDGARCPAAAWLSG